MRRFPLSETPVRQECIQTIYECEKQFSQHNGAGAIEHRRLLDVNESLSAPCFSDDPIVMDKCADQTMKTLKEF